MDKSKAFLIKFIATFFFVGKIKYCPGTFGSLAAFPIYLLVAFLFQENLPIIFIFIAGLFFLGVIVSSLYIKMTKKNDPKEVVIDEVVGQMLTLLFCNPYILSLSSLSLDLGLTYFIEVVSVLCFLPFVLFRFFDVVKPWPISFVDQKIHGGIGVMLDDVLASIFAIISYHIITFTFFANASY